jgi:hypothetical protein
MGTTSFLPLREMHGKYFKDRKKTNEIMRENDMTGMEQN